MEQWLYLLAVVVVLVAGWRLVRPWFERRAGPWDDRRLRGMTESRRARERLQGDKDSFGGGPV